jgi:DNA-binding NtrC family response regulator
MRILIVDDEDSLLLTLVANLELEGFEVIGAGDPMGALELVRREAFDLVLTDIRMPGMNGVELFRTIRSLRPEMPVILMTGFAVEGLVDEAILEGAFAVLPKPFDIEQVIAVLSRAVSRPVVLVVNNREGAEPAAAALRAMGLACRTAADEEVTLSVVRDRQADVIVVDLGMLGSKTPELVERMRAIDPSIAVITIASHLVPDLFQKVAALGVSACLLQPFTPTELVRIIARARARPLARAPSHRPASGAMEA